MQITHDSLFWYQVDLEKDSTYSRDLFDNEKLIIQDCLNQLDKTSNIEEINSTFSMLKSLYDEILHALIYKRGFIIVKGFPTYKDAYTHQQVKTFFLEFSKFLGVPLIQNKNNE